jgi:hypothetical protein
MHVACALSAPLVPKSPVANLQLDDISIKPSRRMTLVEMIAILL